MKNPSACRLGWAGAAGASLWIGAASLLLTVPAGSTAAPAKPSRESASVQTAPPFARVFLAVRGCMSCSHCRTSIRQMVRSNSGGGEARFGEDQVEVLYATPRTVPLRDVIHSLAESRLHDLSLVDVLFEARGTIALAQDGTATFALAETGQSFLLAINPSLSRPAGGTPVRLTAVVEGWRKKGALSLSAKEIRPAGWPNCQSPHAAAPSSRGLSFVDKSRVWPEQSPPDQGLTRRGHVRAEGKVGAGHGRDPGDRQSGRTRARGHGRRHRDQLLPKP